MILRRFFWNKSHLEERRNHVNLSTFSGLAHSFFFRSPQKPPRKNHPPFDFFESFEIWTHNLSEGQRLKAPTYNIYYYIPTKYIHPPYLFVCLCGCLSEDVSIWGCLVGLIDQGLPYVPLGRHPWRICLKTVMDSEKKNVSSFPIVSIIWYI